MTEISQFFTALFSEYLKVFFCFLSMFSCPKSLMSELRVSCSETAHDFESTETFFDFEDLLRTFEIELLFTSKFNYLVIGNYNTLRN